MSVFGRVAGLGFAAAWLVSGPVLAIGAALDATMPDYRRVDGVCRDSGQAAGALRGSFSLAPAA
jgi:hypothetical protein